MLFFMNFSQIKIRSEKKHKKVEGAFSHCWATNVVGNTTKTMLLFFQANSWEPFKIGFMAITRNAYQKTRKKSWKKYTANENYYWISVHFVTATLLIVWSPRNISKRRSMRHRFSLSFTLFLLFMLLLLNKLSCYLFIWDMFFMSFACKWTSRKRSPVRHSPAAPATEKELGINDIFTIILWVIVCSSPPFISVTDFLYIRLLGWLVGCGCWLEVQFNA